MNQMSQGLLGNQLDLLKDLMKKTQPSKKFQNISLMSLGAALWKADRSENAELISRPRCPFSSSKFNSEIIVENTDDDIQDITTIDWDCLKSVTMNTASNSIDIRIPDSAVMQKYKLKQKQLKTGAKSSDDSQLKSCAKQTKSKRVRRNSSSDIPQRKTRKPKNFYKSNHLKFQKSDSTPVHVSTLDSLRGLLGAKIMEEKECLNSLESAFPVANHDTSQMPQSNIYEHVSLLEK